jgi:hypothetical protein
MLRPSGASFVIVLRGEDMSDTTHPAASGRAGVNHAHTPPSAAGEFSRRMDGYLHGMLRWPQLDALWGRVRADAQGWYASQVGEPPPSAPLAAEALRRFVDEVDALLRREHQADYCGIVYADDPAQPTFIKIFDPQHMGSFCGCGSTPIPPRWVLSRCRPEPIVDDAPAPAARRSSWRRLFAG